MKHRLFLAIPLHESLQNIFASYMQTLSQQIYPLYPSIRYIPKKYYHITVCFLGYVDEIELPSIENRITDVLNDMSPFELSFETIFLAPPVGRSTMIWAIFRESQYFSIIARQFQTHLSPLVDTSIRKHHWYVPHVTLARSREILNASKILLPPIQINEQKLQIDNVILYESILGKNGAHYEIKSIYSLTQ